MLKKNGGSECEVKGGKGQKREREKEATKHRGKGREKKHGRW